MPIGPRLAVSVGGVFLRALASTWRYRVVDEHHLTNLRSARQAFVFSLWHGQLLPLIWHHRGEDVAILVSEHKDGEMIARIAASIGYRMIRGSTTRGGSRALLGLVRELNEGREVAVTPDGPRGPATEYAPGALIAAHRAKAPILPIVASVDRAWRLSSWDRFIIPKPFARITVAYGPSTHVEGSSARDAAGETARFERLMAETLKRACNS
ncbi:MAG TPA: lysophospholipid acyltransferase family protein [Gemmatimonadaceae bacterium]|nr:lysophospholipid acyltransferase family protein [Gemmatimonadaceae bacterium]